MLSTRAPGEGCGPALCLPPISTEGRKEGGGREGGREGSENRGGRVDGLDGDSEEGRAGGRGRDGGRQRGSGGRQRVGAAAVCESEESRRQRQAPRGCSSGCPCR
eukprot:88021-Rhodomonas_salina.1